MIAVVVLFWASLAALVWTHVGYPLVAALVARIAPRRIRAADITPSVTVIIAAYNEESVIARRIENLKALDYPSDLLEIVVASDASSDRTEEIAAGLGVRVIRNARAGKVAAQNRAVRETESEIVALDVANAPINSSSSRPAHERCTGTEVHRGPRITRSRSWLRRWL